MPNIQIPKDNSLLPLARYLRSHMTRHEKKLWYEFLAFYPVRFRRQRIIDRYIVDFFCDAARLVIELDGSQHYEPEIHRADLGRTENLSKYGILVLRYDNMEIDKQFRWICEQISQVTEERLAMFEKVKS